MSLGRLVIENVRCIEQAECAIGPGRNFLIGENGAGKTSCLEAIHLLSRGRSFRTRQAAQLVKQGTPGFSVFGELMAGPGQDSMGRRLGIAYQSASLQTRLDGRVPESLAEFARAFPVHVLDPKLHSLIESGPSERRRFLDSGVFHVEPRYLAAWKAYRKALMQRNAALKHEHVGGVEPWSAALIEMGQVVHGFRETYCERLSEVVHVIAERLLGTGLALRYRPGWRADLALAEALERSVPRDRSSGFTQVGPHRADIEVCFTAGAVRDLASRGQQKLVAAALVLGQVSVLQQRTGRGGTLLVDDPAAELDDGALERLLAEIDELDVQSLISGLRLAPLRAMPGDPVFHVERGMIKPMVY